MNGVLVVAEVDRDRPREISFELMAAASALSEAGAGPVKVAVIAANAGSIAPGLGRRGVDEILTVESPVEHFEPHVAARALGRLIDDEQPALVLAGHTVDGAAFAPATAAEQSLAFASNVASIAWVDGAPQAYRGAYGARLLAQLAFPGRPALLMVRPGAYAAADVEADVPVRATEIDAGAGPTTHVAMTNAERAGVDITKAEFLLSIGRGIGARENVERFARLADRLGATLSASGPLVEGGWVEPARLVGQSGRTVRPKVYLALGISGAAQHVASIRNAETVIAVNTDPEAPIWRVADVGAIVDALALADALEQHF